MLKFLIGVVVPFVGVMGLLPWTSSIDITVFGVPFVYAWIFTWFFLTFVCLSICWYVFDRHTDPADTSIAAE